MRSRILALGAIGALALTAQVPAPAPAPSTLPEIGRVHSKGLCTTVRDSVAPMVLGLMKSDELVGAGHRAFLKMADDTRTDPSPTKVGLALQIDQLYMRKAVDAMAHNLVIIDKLLADDKQFPKKATTDDDRIALLLKEQIAAVAAQQRKTLDVMNGALETDALGRMQNDFGGGSTVMGATAGTNAPKGSLSSPERGPDPSGSFVGVAGLSMPENGSTTIDPRTLATGKTAGHTVWDRFARTVEAQQSAIAGAEQRLSPTVVAISIACRAELASPSPRPSP
jgi:hypothetical protein